MTYLLKGSRDIGEYSVYGIGSDFVAWDRNSFGPWRIACSSVDNIFTIQYQDINFSNELSGGILYSPRSISIAANGCPSVTLTNMVIKTPEWPRVAYSSVTTTSPVILQSKCASLRPLR